MSDIKKNFGYQISYQILLSILPFITSPYVSRVLGADGIGIYSYTLTIVTYFKIFASLGIANYGNRLIAKSKNEQSELNRAFSSLVTLHTILTFVVILLYVVYLFYILRDNRLVASIQIIYLLAEMFDINWFFFGMEKFKITVTRNAIIKIFTVVCVFIFVKSRADLWKYVLILALGTLLSNSILWIFAPKYVKFQRFKLVEMLAHIRPMFILFLSVIAISVFSYMDKIMIGAMSSSEQLGYYENAWKMIEFPTAIITALGTVMLPKMSYLSENGNKQLFQHYIYQSLRFSLVTSIAIAFGIASIANDFSVMFWGNEFISSGKIMVILSPVIIIMAFNSVIRTQYLIPKEQDKAYLIAVLCGAISNLVVNALLIPLYGALGASVATVLSYIAICIIQILYTYKNIRLRKGIVESIAYVVPAIIMYGVVKICGWYSDASVLLVICEIIFGAATFCGLSLAYAYIFKDRFIIENIKIIWSKVHNNNLEVK